MFITDGAFLLPNFPSTPTLMATVSANANFGLWQLPQLMVLSFDKMGSKNNFSPSFILEVGIS
ncbi:MAG: hypothetical protein IPJ39_17815 [Saprospiraceae bacterium]|nr:hypothetical protein [Saprospiraceae bacterium]